MNRNQTKVSIVIVVLTVLVGIWAAREYFSPIIHNNISQTKTISLENESKVSFSKDKGQGKVTGIELELSGNSASNFDLIISDGKNDIHTAAVKGKNIDFVYKNNWESDVCNISIYPREEIGGKVIVEVRFLSEE